MDMKSFVLTPTPYFCKLYDSITLSVRNLCCSGNLLDQEDDHGLYIMNNMDDNFEFFNYYKVGLSTYPLLHNKWFLALGVVFGGTRCNLGFVHILALGVCLGFVHIIDTRMFKSDNYSGLDDFYEKKHHVVLVERGEVNLRPYTVLRQFPLSNMCLRDQQLWRVRCPKICFFAVEWHLPHRVSKQFGVQQRSPPDHVETSVVLHKKNRQNNKSLINWKEHHIMWVDMWNAQRNA
ncbi:hypothetical protein D1007_34621 [Hordeum vulgare]|nr:hypothetical protein D1007_34621 [Hordeum vulgare]